MLKAENANDLREMVSCLHQSPQRIVDAIASYEEETKGVSKEEREQSLREAIASNTSGKVMNDEVAAAVLFKVETDALAHMWAMAYFQDTPLADNEWPIVMTDKRDGQVKCLYVGESGGTVKRQKVERKTHAQYLLERFSSEEVEYQLNDLQVGNVSHLDQVSQELTYESNLSIDALARAVVDANTSASGLRAKLNLHRSISSANIPDKNYYDLNSSESGKEGKWTVEKFKTILDHMERFTSDVELDGQQLQIRVIDMSSVNKRDLWDFCDLVAGFNLSGAVQDPQKTVPTEVRTEIYRSGKLESMFGYKFVIRTRNTIASGTAYVATNKPIGWYWNKPGMANVYREENRKKNKGSMSLEKVHSFCAPESWQYRMLKIKL